MNYKIILEFTRNIYQEPGAYIQSEVTQSISGYYFYDWRDAIHYLLYHIKHYSDFKELTYLNWKKDNNYLVSKRVTNLNEFNDMFTWWLDTSIGDIANCIENPLDLYNISAWTYKQNIYGM